MELFAKVILSGIILFVLEILGFEFSIGPWIFLSSLALCFTIPSFMEWKESRKERE